MKKNSKISIQGRVTILTAILLIVCSIILTIFSMSSAKTMMWSLLESSAETTLAVDSEGEEEIGEAGEEGGAVASESAEQAKQRFDMRGVLFCIGITVCGSVAAWFISGKALKPLSDLSKKVENINEHNLSYRLPRTSSNDEISQLTESFNFMLARIEAAFQRQKRFTANAAHELKTPLATIKAGNQVLLHFENTNIQDYRENTEITINCIDRLTEVVNNLLLLASADEKREQKRERIELDAMMEAVFSDLEPLYEQNNISYNINCEENIIIGDPAMLYQVFYNLIENAYKYNKKNGEIFVRSYVSGENICIKIADTGEGIPEEYLPLIFESFYRVDQSRSRKIAGAGLGLSIARTIIEQNDGTITVESQKGKGTAFTIKFKRVM